MEQLRNIEVDSPFYGLPGRRARVVDAFTEAVRGVLRKARGEKYPERPPGSDAFVKADGVQDLQTSLNRFRGATEDLLQQGFDLWDSKQREFGEVFDSGRSKAKEAWEAKQKEFSEGLDALLGPSGTAASHPTYGVVAHHAAARRAGISWIVPVEAWLFRRNNDRHVLRLMLCQKFLIEMFHGIKNVDVESQKRYEERGRMIFRTLAFRGGEGQRQLEVRFGGPDGGGAWTSLPLKTDSYGRVDADVRIPNHIVMTALRESRAEGRKVSTIRMDVRSDLPVASDGDPGCTGDGDESLASASAMISLVEEVGFTVVSDIDDTVKVTEVFLGKDAVVRNTFFEEFRAVGGMADLFDKWAREIQGIDFHFVSNSPPELLEPLRTFLDQEGFPNAPLHLRPLRGENRPDFKRRTIEKLLRDFPSRRFLLVGDSGEVDVDIYSDLYRRYPGRVAKVLIRQVENGRSVDDGRFVGVNPKHWQVFMDPSEVDVSWSD